MTSQKKYYEKKKRVFFSETIVAIYAYGAMVISLGVFIAKQLRDIATLAKCPPSSTRNVAVLCRTMRLGMLSRQSTMFST